MLNISVSALSVRIHDAPKSPADYVFEGSVVNFQNHGGLKHVDKTL